LPVNDPAAARADEAAVDANSTGVVIDVLANDSIEPDANETLRVVSATAPAHGSVLVATDGTSVKYAPVEGYWGADSFTYTIDDGNGGTASATVSIDVAAPTIISIEVTERVVISDTPSVTPAVMVNVDESVRVTDAPDVDPLEPIVIDIAESVVVSDAPTATPAVMVDVAEAVRVTDGPVVDPVEPIVIDVSESVVISDAPAPVPSVIVDVAETVTVSDEVTAEIVDTTPPTVAITSPGAATYQLNQSVVAAYTCTDADSGIASCKGTVVAGQPIDTSTEGEHQFGVEAIDRAGLRTTELVTYSVLGVEGRMTGDAAIEAGNVTHDVRFRVAERSLGAERGSVTYIVRTRSARGRPRVDRFESTAIDVIAFWDQPGVIPGRGATADSATFTGTGTWNGAAGYTFEITAVDLGEPGRGRDTLSIVVRDGGGRVVANVEGTVTNGNIQSMRLRQR
jgi:hypothetical protein